MGVSQLGDRFHDGIFELVLSTPKADRGEMLLIPGNWRYYKVLQ